MQEVLNFFAATYQSVGAKPGDIVQQALPMGAGLLIGVEELVMAGMTGIATQQRFKRGDCVTCLLHAKLPEGHRHQRPGTKGI